MKTYSKLTVLAGLLLIIKIGFASTMLGSYTPTFQYFTITVPPSIIDQQASQPSTDSNFEVIGSASCGVGCAGYTVGTTPNSSKGGNVNFIFTVSNGKEPTLCFGYLNLPLTVDSKGNIETNNASYPIDFTSGCNAPTMTAIVTGDPTSTNGYQIAVH